jgi:hypothetical protein
MHCAGCAGRARIRTFVCTNDAAQHPPRVYARMRGEVETKDPTGWGQKAPGTKDPSTENQLNQRCTADTKGRLAPLDAMRQVCENSGFLFYK